MIEQPGLFAPDDLPEIVPIRIPVFYTGQGSWVLSLGPLDFEAGLEQLKHMCVQLKAQGRHVGLLIHVDSLRDDQRAAQPLVTPKDGRR